jgi:hypothetical protein
MKSLPGVVPTAGSTPWRKRLECVSISLYRQEHQRSPTVNFGRMPLGYRMSSANNARHVSKEKRFRGGADSEQDESHLPGVAPMGQLGGNPSSLTWCGHRWSEWIAASQALRAIPPKGTGLYRLRAPGHRDLLYIGQGLIRDRLQSHLSKIQQPTHRQSTIFTESMECSWVGDASWWPHQRLELENDLIAAHILEEETVPLAQILG